MTPTSAGKKPASPGVSQPSTKVEHESKRQQAILRKLDGRTENEQKLYLEERAQELDRKGKELESEARKAAEKLLLMGTDDTPDLKGMYYDSEYDSFMELKNSEDYSREAKRALNIIIQDDPNNKYSEHVTMETLHGQRQGDWALEIIPESAKRLKELEEIRKSHWNAEKGVFARLFDNKLVKQALQRVQTDLRFRNRTPSSERRARAIRHDSYGSLMPFTHSSAVPTLSRSPAEAPGTRARSSRSQAPSPGNILGWLNTIPTPEGGQTDQDYIQADKEYERSRNTPLSEWPQDTKRKFRRSSPSSSGIANRNLLVPNKVRRPPERSR
ncbi:MAG: hypothetical protein CYPHOPRED_001838 [Cyphobasidiales sp. Tagirdzhanova-0007]|nr:MAG: hypothetical protein CYPHOPRED_001838 [Cyphobasidiales sp. Tagirdzhanova-0007]